MIELDLTPNRGDCLGMRGIAREVGYSVEKKCASPIAMCVQPVHGRISVTISAPRLALAIWAGDPERKAECLFATVDAGKAQAFGCAALTQSLM